MTNQEAYNRVRDHLLTQSARSARWENESGEACLYRGPGGLMCAVGCLIPDEQYAAHLEGYSVVSLLDSAGEYYVPALEGLSLALLSDLQHIHDDFAPDTWGQQLRAAAVRHGLTP